ncbi:MAG TPA: 16S rRNA (cytosine(1402)-N(4))-methyltransferase RsmH, partial [Egibacteraceae bacterium]
MAEEASVHEPVMLERCVELLAVREGPAVLVDATVGAAGHAAALLAASGPDVALVGLDRDPEALALAQRRLAAYGDRVTLVHAPYDELAAHVAPVAERVGPVLGILYDLGVSSLQLDRPERGFSFRADAPLDMRMDPTAGETAAELLERLDVDALTRILRDYGEERYARRIAAAIVRQRPLRTTRALADVVAAAVPAAARRGPIHPATRTFQALRIAVNDELSRFSASLPQALDTAAPATPERRGGRIVVLSYHSLEDRIAKRTLTDATTGCVCPPDLPVCACGRVPRARWLTRGVERPDAAETARNPRARSARLRAVEMLPVAAAPENPTSVE